MVVFLYTLVPSQERIWCLFPTLWDIIRVAAHTLRTFRTSSVRRPPPMAFSTTKNIGSLDSYIGHQAFNPTIIFHLSPPPNKKFGAHKAPHRTTPATARVTRPKGRTCNPLSPSGRAYHIYLSALCQTTACTFLIYNGVLLPTFPRSL